MDLSFHTDLGFCKGSAIQAHHNNNRTVHL